jgi:hypothetical protein
VVVLATPLVLEGLTVAGAVCSKAMSERVSVLGLVAVLITSLIAGCQRVSLPRWHQTAVFAAADSIVAPDFETPVDLSPQRIDDRRWVVQSPVVTARRGSGFDQAIGSWNIELMPGAAAAIDLSVNDGAGWSPRLRLGHVGDAGLLDPPVRHVSTDDRTAGFIDTDYFMADRTFTRAQLTVTFVAAAESTSRPPGRVARLALCLSRVGERDDSRPAALSRAARENRVEVPTPFRSQKTDDPSLAGRLCSPTSLSMVLAAHGVDEPVQQVAARVRDPDFDIYGNWPRNVQAAFDLGVPGFVTRFNDWLPVVQHLQRGEPLIVSIRAPRGLIRNAPYRELNGGHLIVLRGLDGRGGVLVNDPAADRPERGQRTYRIDDLSKAWLDLGNGTAYVLLKRPTSVAK